MLLIIPSPPSPGTLLMGACEPVRATEALAHRPDNQEKRTRGVGEVEGGWLVGGLVDVIWNLLVYPGLQDLLVHATTAIQWHSHVFFARTRPMIGLR